MVHLDKGTLLNTKKGGITDTRQQLSEIKMQYPKGKKPDSKAV